MADPTPADAPAIITIDGIDGSGKSTFADGLTAGLRRAGWGTVLFRVDDFRRPLPEPGRAGATGVPGGDAGGGSPASEAELYYRDYYDLALLDSCLRAFQARARGVTIPVFDPRTERLAGTRDLVFDGTGTGTGTGAVVAVVEGVFALRVPTAASGLVIYIDLPGVEARRRLTERDLARGRSRETIEHRLAARYLPAQQRYQQLFDPGARADVVIDNRQPAAPRCVRRTLTRVDAALAGVLDRLLPA